jgi:cytosine/adenosine deaminase-related metal-dependent hydrolase
LDQRRRGRSEQSWRRWSAARQVVGGAPRYDTDGPPRSGRIFALAKEYDVDVDIHLDGGHTTDDMDIYQVMGLTDKMGWGGRVAIGHGSKYSCLPPEELAALGRRLGGSGVAVSVLPATDMFNVGRHMEHTVMRGRRRRQRADRGGSELLDRNQQHHESVHAPSATAR